MSSGSGSSSRRSPPRGLSPIPTTSRSAAAVAAAQADPDCYRRVLIRTLPPRLSDRRDGDATPNDSVAAQDAAALYDASRTGTSGVSAPRAGTSGVSTPRAGTSGVSTPRAGASCVPARRSGTSGDGTPINENFMFKFSHILIKHRNSRRPIDNNNKPVTRTKDQAMDLVIDIHEQISRDLITFADAAVAFSDCTSARHDGDVHYPVHNGRAQKSFRIAALALSPGKISDIIETRSGYHIIQRAEADPAGESHRRRRQRNRNRSRSPREQRTRSRSPREQRTRSRSPREQRTRSRSPLVHATRSE